jgi:carbohydrate-selective porin OprB
MHRLLGRGTARRRGLAFAAAAMLAVAAPEPALAESKEDAPRKEEARRDLWSGRTLAGDWGGVRGALGARGIALTFNYIGEALGNVRGGERRLAPWWIVQPDLQIIFHPGGKIPNPRNASGASIRDAVVPGVRTTLKF